MTDSKLISEMAKLHDGDSEQPKSHLDYSSVPKTEHIKVPEKELTEDEEE